MAPMWVSAPGVEVGASVGSAVGSAVGVGSGSGSGVGVGVGSGGSTGGVTSPPGALGSPAPPVPPGSWPGFGPPPGPAGASTASLPEGDADPLGTGDAEPAPSASGPLFPPEPPAVPPCRPDTPTPPSDSAATPCFPADLLGAGFAPSSLTLIQPLIPAQAATASAAAAHLTRVGKGRTEGTSRTQGAEKSGREHVSLPNSLCPARDTPPEQNPAPESLRDHFGHAPRNRAAVTDNGGVLEMTRDAFEELVAQALDTIPPELTRVMDNVAVFVEDEPDPSDPELLGLYEGTPLTERGEWYAGVLPDRISIYMGPTLRYCESQEDVVHEVAVTVVHEIAHHFGIDDERLHELGWG